MKILTYIILIIVFAQFVTLGECFATEEIVSATPSIKITSVQSCNWLNKCFRQNNGWIGGDSAYSINIDPYKAIWLFGETFIGSIEKNKRTNFDLIHNSLAWKDPFSATGCFQFFWDTNKPKPGSLFKTNKESERYYRPADGCLVDGKLYIFFRQVQKRDKEAEDWFNFETVGTDLFRVENPKDKPTKWQITKTSLAEPILENGAACLLAGDYLYIYGANPFEMAHMFKTPLVLSRISKQNLQQLNVSAIEYWCQEGNKYFWGKDASKRALLFDAAGEFSVKKLNGIDGYVAIYISSLDNKIVLRHSLKPEGPWSDSVLIYTCPEANKDVIAYAAKAHPELSFKNNELVITYCLNMEKLAYHIKQPDIYFPKAILVKFSNN